MTVEFRSKECRSWLDRKWASVFSRDLYHRLKRRLKGEKWLMLTLTYRPGDWSSARDLFRSQREHRHVREFIDRLGRALGENLTGRWMRKMEFQKNGNVHWHLIIVGLDFIDHEIVERCWGFGFVFCSRPRIRYLSKMLRYVGKGGGIPPWLYLQPVRSIRIVSASPGFWTDTDDDPPVIKRFDPRVPPGVGYVCLADAIDAARHQTTIRDDEGRYRIVPVSPWDLALHLAKSGISMQAGESGWLRAHVSSIDALCKHAAGCDGRASGRARRGLHLIEKQKPRISETLRSVLDDLFIQDDRSYHSRSSDRVRALPRKSKEVLA
ncbi:MAG: hypothetical protein AAF356_01780 [Planctomycetota bacterium]